MFLGWFSGVTPVFAARSTCHVRRRLVTSNRFCLPPCLYPVSCCTPRYTHTPHTIQLDLYIQDTPSFRRQQQDLKHWAVSIRPSIKYKSGIKMKNKEPRERSWMLYRTLCKYLHCVHPLLVGPWITWGDERKPGEMNELSVIRMIQKQQRRSLWVTNSNPEGHIIKQLILRICFEASPNKLQLGKVLSLNYLRVVQKNICFLDIYCLKFLLH